jgi:hypothetical protein
MTKSALDMANGIGYVATPTNWGNVAKGVGDLASGIESHTEGRFRDAALKKDPAAVHQREASTDALWHGISDKYSSPGHFLATLADEPGSVASDAATFLPGVGGVARAGQELAAAGNMARTAEVLGGVGRTAEELGKWSNPIMGGAQTAAGIAGKAVPHAINLAKEIPQNFQSMQTGVPVKLLQTASRIDRTRAYPHPPGVDLKAEYTRAATGGTSADEIAARIKQAAKKAKQQDVASLRAQKGNLIDQPVDVTPVVDAHNAHMADAARGTGVENLHPSAQAADQWVNNVTNRLVNGDPAGRSIYELDGLKQTAWDMSRAEARNPLGSTQAKGIYDNLYHSLDATIRDANPEYSKVMDASQQAQEATASLENTMGAHSKSGAAATAKALKAIRTPDGSNMLDKLAENDPGLPAAMAGHASQDLLPSKGMAQRVLRGEIGATGILGMAAGALHSPAAAAAAIPAMAGEAITASPRLMLGANRAAGAGRNLIDQAAGAVSDATPQVIKSGLSAAGDVASSAAKGVASHAAQIGGVTGELATAPENAPIDPSLLDKGGFHASQLDHPPPTEDPDELPPGYTKRDLDPAPAPTVAHENDEMPPGYDKDGNEIPPPQPHAAGGRVPFARGGKIDDGHERLVNRLMRMAEHAKKASNEVTEPLLKAPDEHIVKALAIAKKAI